ncbi:MAG TPA: hypothetical protein VGH09_01015 [Solirubrobacteraceae bacterium]
MGCDVLRFLLWRLLAVLAVLGSYVLVGWFLRGGPGRLLRSRTSPSPSQSPSRALTTALHSPVAFAHALGASTPGRVSFGLLLATLISLSIARWAARRRRDYARFRVDVYRTDHASPMASATSGRTTST